MANPFYAEMRAFAAEQIAEYGADLTLIERTEGDYDPALGKRAAGVETRTPFKGLVKSPRRYFRGDSVVEATDQEILAVLDAKPSRGAWVLIDGREQRVVAVHKVAPGGEAVFYKLMVEL